ncbi:MAG: GntR family transcriptional regulator [Kineothrix sp.]|nr:GntR family transcriptional regulator [Kineothrix sp.]
MKKVVNNVLYQKKGVTISHVASSLLSRRVGDRIPSISEYQQEFGVSRGTMQNALNYLKEIDAIQLSSRGHMGTYIEKIDYVKLQDSTLVQELMGIMPLPYSRTYEGLATAVYEQLKDYRFNMAYARGAVGRIKLVETGTYQFAICSQYAAEYAIENGKNIEIVQNFGDGSFVSQHVLVLRDSKADGIQDGMRVAYDCDSLDQGELTKRLIKGKKVKLVDIRTQLTLAALDEGMIDAGIWNYDDILETKSFEGLHIVTLNKPDYSSEFATAVIVIQKGNAYLKEVLDKNISKRYTLTVLEEVRKQKRRPSY